MVQKMCRTCLATCGELVSIFSDDYFVRNLPDKLLNTMKIEVSQDDDLPKMMCKKCVFLLDSLYCFKDQCEMAEIKLKKTLKGVLASDHSDIITSSEEEYQIEYVSEEARLEVENARKRSRNAKKKINNKSGVKVKSVEILPTESKDNIYKSLSSVSSSKYEVSEIDEDINQSDSDDRSSLYISEDSKKKLLSTFERKNNREPYSTTEKINLLKSQMPEKFQEKAEPSRVGSKRKMGSDISLNQLSKVPKKVIFKEKNYDDANMQFIELSDNQANKKQEDTSIKADDDADTIMQINVIENKTGKIVQNYDIAVKEHPPPKSTTNALSSFELLRTSVDSDTKKVLDLRMQNLIKHIVLSIPEICAICSESFDNYLDVLKHKIEIHLNTNQDLFFCPICHEKFFTNSSLVEHLDVHKDVHSFICILCSGSFYTKDTLRTHLHSHVDLHDLKCHICSKKFNRIQNLLTHLELHVTNKQLVCTLCSDNFNDKDTLQRHIHNEHKKSQDAKPKCKTCGERFPKDEMEEHSKTHAGFPCPYCERSFSMKTTLRDHVFTHLGVQQYSCLVCDKTFTSQEERTQHMQEHMKPQQKGDRKKFRCRVCHEILVSRVAYGQHLKEKHWNSKQTSEILRELSESSMNEKVNEQFTKICATPPASESVSLP